MDETPEGSAKRGKRKEEATEDKGKRQVVRACGIDEKNSAQSDKITKFLKKQQLPRGFCPVRNLPLRFFPLFC